MSTTAPPKPTEAPRVEDDDDRVLDFTTMAPARRLVKLPTKRKPEGEVFELRLLDDFGIADQQRLLRMTRRYEGLMNSDDELDAEARDQLKHYLDSLFEELLDAPKVVKKDMPDGVRGRVVTTFSIAPLLAQREMVVQVETKAARRAMKEMDDRSTMGS